MVQSSARHPSPFTSQNHRCGSETKLWPVLYRGSGLRPRLPRVGCLPIRRVCARGSKTNNDYLQTPYRPRGRFAKRWNENLSDMGQTHRVLRQELLHSIRVRESTNTSNSTIGYLRLICRWVVNDRGLRQSFHNGTPWLPWSPFRTANFLTNCYAARSSPSGSLVPSAPSHI